MILAINKIDVLGADPAEVEKEIVERTGLALETNGGNIPVTMHILGDSYQCEIQEKHRFIGRISAVRSRIP